MELHLSSEAETELRKLAISLDVPPEQIALEAVDRMLEQARLQSDIIQARSSLAAGRYLDHHEVGRRIDKLFQV